MNNLILAAFILLIYFSISGCNSNTTSVSDQNNILYLRGNIQPADSVAFGKIVGSAVFRSKSYYLAEGKIDSLGNYELIVPPVPDNLLSSKLYDYTIPFGTTTRFYSDSSAKFYDPLYLTIFNKELRELRIFSVGDTLPNERYNRIGFYFFTTKNILFSGKDSSYNPENLTSEVRNFNLSLKVGWNKVIYNWLPKEGNTQYIDVYVDNSVHDIWVFSNAQN